MSATPLLMGLAAAGLLILLIGSALAVRRLLDRPRITSWSKPDAGYDGWLADPDWISRPERPQPDPGDHVTASEPEASEPVQAGGSAEQPALEAAERRVEEMLAAAAHQGASILRDSEVQAERRAQELLEDAERRCESMVRESEAEAGRRATEITQGAWKQARKLLEKAELDAKEVVAAAEHERRRLVDELARERALVEETRTRLSAFLVDVLEEVDGAPGEVPSTNIHDLSEAREMRTTAAGDS